MNDVKFDDAAWKKIVASLGELGRARVRVGVIGEAAERVHETSKGKITVAEVAAINEFGSEAAGVPERSFIRRAMESGRGEASSLLTAAATRALSGSTSSVAALQQTARWAADRVRATIDEGVDPANAAATIDRKGFDHPLVGTTGMLRDAISSDVEVTTGSAEPEHDYELYDLEGME